MMPYSSAVTADDFHCDTRAYFSDRPVLVTGGGGFIGSHVVEQLVRLGAHPSVISRRGTLGFLDGHDLPVSALQGDLTREDDAARLFGSIQGAVVMHLAADVGGLSYNMAHPASIFDHNMRMALNVLEGSLKGGAARVLVCSSACVYPRFCTVPTPEEEGFLDEPEPTNAGYGWAKRMLEFLGARYHEEFGLPVAIARPYNAYGPRDEFDPERSHVIPALIRKAFETETGTLEVWGDGSASRSFIYVDDFARGLIETAARYPEADALNVGTDEEVPIGSLARMVADIVGEMRGRQIRTIFDTEKPAGQPRRNCATGKAFEKIGFEARVTLPDGLRATIEWYREHEHSADRPR